MAIVFTKLPGDAPYNWEAAGESRFDRCAMALNNEFETSPPLVEAIVDDAVGGFCLRFVNGYMFEVFPDETTAGVSEH